MEMSRHATVRAQQRALRPDILELITACGTPRHVRGALSLCLDDLTIDLIAGDDRHQRQTLARYRGAYVIEAPDGRLITAARRLRRHRR